MSDGEDEYDWRNMTYRDLQDWARAYRLPVNLKKQMLIAVLQARVKGHYEIVDILLNLVKETRMKNKMVKKEDKQEDIPEENVRRSVRETIPSNVPNYQILTRARYQTLMDPGRSVDYPTQSSNGAVVNLNQIDCGLPNKREYKTKPSKSSLRHLSDIPEENVRRSVRETIPSNVPNYQILTRARYQTLMDPGRSVDYPTQSSNGAVVNLNQIDCGLPNKREYKTKPSKSSLRHLSGEYRSPYFYHPPEIETTQVNQPPESESSESSESSELSYVSHSQDSETPHVDYSEESQQNFNRPSSDLTSESFYRQQTYNLIMGNKIKTNIPKSKHYLFKLYWCSVDNYKNRVCCAYCRRIEFQDVPEHEMHCMERTLKCPLPGCIWFDQMLSLGDHIKGHIELVRNRVASFIVDFGSESYDISYKAGPSNTGPKKICYLQSFGDRLFVISVVGYFQRMLVYVYIQYLEDNRNFQSMSELEVSHLDGTYQCRVGSVESLNVSVKKLISSHSCLKIRTTVNSLAAAPFKLHSRIFNYY